ncbi:hypothetical protein [Streptococcus suis]|uniref:hypothetical protein n=1 Tax=Streptococcus suis TaxID=1307 RepID=UPI00240F9AAC|nr:hypothetical protein [Streptococcus suis]
MLVKKIAFGNLEEAFIEEGLTDGVNIIFSDDNNKGKTLLFQAFMYSIGNTPIFPGNFKKEDYYFYSMINCAGVDYEFLRKKDTFLVIFLQEFHIFETLSELKYFLKQQKIFDIPVIEKNGREKVADLELFYELFFVGQDNRNPSNIINKGYYNKSDFSSMIVALKGYSNISNSKELDEIKEEINAVKNEIKANKKYLKLLKTDKQVSSYLDKFTSNEEFKNFKNRSKQLNDKIGEIKRDRNREQARQDKLVQLLKELNSLNREIKSGNVYCTDCGSSHISFKNRDVNFDLSNAEVRKHVLNSIDFQISMSKNEVTELNEELNKIQDELKTLLMDTPNDFRKSLLYSEIIKTDMNYDDKLLELDRKLHSLQFDKSIIEQKGLTNRDGIKSIKENVVAKMNTLYKVIDPDGKLVFDDLFTKKEATYSGSDGQVYYFCRLISLNNLLKHTYPIINDSFREGEISTRKEELMIDYYKKLNKQVILSATLKNQEYAVDKYSNIEGVNTIDYSINDDSKILNSKYTDEFILILKKFNIETSTNY